jgi:Tetratricopeptide repeat
LAKVIGPGGGRPIGHSPGWVRRAYKAGRPRSPRILTGLGATDGAPTTPTPPKAFHNLALLLRDQGDLDQACTLLKRALAVFDARLGPDHADTKRSREHLAAVVAALENRQ